VSEASTPAGAAEATDGGEADAGDDGITEAAGWHATITMAATDMTLPRLPLTP
jgi:hypothetical protein